MRKFLPIPGIAWVIVLALIIGGAITISYGVSGYLKNEDQQLTDIMLIAFGVSLQIPVVMLFLAKAGRFTWRDYWRKWRFALMIIALFSAIIAPTPDAVTMLYFFLPMFGLYMMGIYICRWVPERSPEDEPSEDEIAV